MFYQDDANSDLAMWEDLTQGQWWLSLSSPSPEATQLDFPLSVSGAPQAVVSSLELKVVAWE